MKFLNKLLQKERSKALSKNCTPKIKDTYNLISCPKEDLRTKNFTPNLLEGGTLEKVPLFTRMLNKINKFFGGN